MNTSANTGASRAPNGSKSRRVAVVTAVVVLALSAAAYAFLTRGAPGYATPEEAGKALLAAIDAGDRDAIRGQIEPECSARVPYADGVADRLALVKSGVRHIPRAVAVGAA